MRGIRKCRRFRYRYIAVSGEVKPDPFLWSLFYVRQIEPRILRVERTGLPWVLLYLYFQPVQVLYVSGTLRKVKECLGKATS